jgi:cytochrome c553
MRHLPLAPTLFVLLASSFTWAAPAKVVGPPEVAWKDLTKEQKAKYMKAAVTPKMKVVFQEFDPKLFAKFNCATCHGKEAKKREFKMPNPEIHPLPGSEAAFMEMMKKKPSWEKWAKFMGEKVEPQMATLLGKPVFDPKKPDPAAFGCGGCHTIEKK